MYNLFRTAKGVVLSGSLIVASLLFSSASASTSQNNASNTQVDKIYDSYKVKQIQVVTRHGDRSPIVVWKGEAHTDFPLPKWYCDHDEQGVVECSPGQLTTRGKKQHIDLGTRLRHLYIDSLQALSSTYNKDEVFVRSTDITRTKQSAQNLLLGLYPPATRKGEDIPIVSLPIRNETLFTDYHCARFKQLFEEFRKSFKHTHSSELESEDETHLDINGVPVHYDLLRHGTEHEQHVGNFKEKFQKFIKSTEGHDYNLTEIFDLFTCIQNHHHHHDTHGSHDSKKQLQDSFGVDEHTVDKLGRVSAYHWWFPYAASKEVARLGIGRAIGDVHHEMETALSSNNPHKFVLYSGHDSTIAPVLAALEVFDGHWPPYASNIVFELLESKEKPADHYVRMIYNQNVVNLPRCASDAKENGTLCPFDKFQEIAKLVTPVNYVEECKPRVEPPSQSLASTNDLRKFQI